MRTACILLASVLIFFGLFVFSRLFAQHCPRAVALRVRWKFSGG